MKALTALLLVVFVCAACGLQPRADRFASIRQLVCDGQYEEAIPKLESYTGRHASRAGLFLGKAHLALGDLQSARHAFEDTVRNYPQTLEAHKCRYKLALVTWLEGDAASARKQFAHLSQHPDGPLAAEATAMERFVQ